MDNARDLLDRETFIVINGKIITDIDLNAALETHRATTALATLVLLPNIARERFSVVETADGFVKRFGGMPDAASELVESDKDAPLMFTGIQILEPRIFDYIPRGVFSHSTTDVYPQAIAKGERIAAHVAKGNWYELSTIKRYLEVSLIMLAERGQTFHKGADCDIAGDADVDHSILWDDVTIEPGARVRRSVIADGVRIRRGEVIENAAIVRAELVRGKTPPAKALHGYFNDDNFVVPIGS